MVTHDPRAAERAKRTLHLEKGTLTGGGARMKYLPLVWRNLFRRKFRTTFTIGCIFISFVLYAFLMIVRAAFTRAWTSPAPIACG